MNKSELASAVADQTNLSQKDAKKVINAVTESIASELASGGSVQILGFGTFSTRQRAERIGRNPSNGEQITIPSMIVPKFKAGSALKNEVNA